MKAPGRLIGVGFALLSSACSTAQRPPVVSADRLELERLEYAWFVEHRQPPPGTCKTDPSPLCTDGIRLAVLYEDHDMPERAALIDAVLQVARPRKVRETPVRIVVDAPPPAPATRAVWRLRAAPDSTLRGTLTGDGPVPTRLDLENRLAPALPGLVVLSITPRAAGFIAQVLLPAERDVLAPAVTAALGGIHLERKDPPPLAAAPASDNLLLLRSFQSRLPTGETPRALPAGGP